MSARCTPIAFVVTVGEASYGGEYGSREMRLNGVLIGWRPYDGSSEREIADEVSEVFAAILRERLGWPMTDPDESEAL